MLALRNIYSRKNNLSDGEFIRLIQHKIKIRNRFRIIWIIIAIISVIIAFIPLFLLQNNPMGNLYDITKYQWLGFISGFFLGGICFFMILISLISLLNGINGLAIHRTQELLIKYYERSQEMKNRS